jgi:hypothetical protein
VNGTIGRPHLEVWIRAGEWLACMPGLYGAPLIVGELGLTTREIRQLLRLLFGAEVE